MSSASFLLFSNLNKRWWCFKTAADCKCSNGLISLFIILGQTCLSDVLIYFLKLWCSSWDGNVWFCALIYIWFESTLMEINIKADILFPLPFIHHHCCLNLYYYCLYHCCHCYNNHLDYCCYNTSIVTISSSITANITIPDVVLLLLVFPATLSVHSLTRYIGYMWFFNEGQWPFSYCVLLLGQILE